MEIRARLAVLGSLNIDISVAVPTLPTPGATVLGGAASFAPGGKGANQAVAAARLGAEANIRVRMIGCVGDDDFGRTLTAALAGEGIDASAVRVVPEVPTGIAMITVDQAGENIITVAPGANREVGQHDLQALQRAPENPGGGPAAAESPEGRPAASDAQPPGVLVISAEIPVAAIQAALAEPSAAGRLTVVNLAPAPPREQARVLLRLHPDWLVVNESEAAAILGVPVNGLPGAAEAAAALVEAGASNAVVTAGAAGAAYRALNHQFPRTVAPFAIHARDTVGAGDTFVGALAVALAAGVAPDTAVTAACAAGAAAATRPGTQAGMPRPADIRAATGYAWPISAAR